MEANTQPIAEPGKAAWLRWRLGGIGASEAHIVVKGTPDQVRDLWAEKRGAIVRPFDDALGELGLFLEPLIRIRYMRETKREIEIAQPIEHASIRWLRCTPDGYTLRDGVKGCLELKSLDGHLFARAKLEGLPDRYWIQVQHQMLVTNLSFASLAVLCRNTGRFYNFDVERDESFMTHILLPRCERFWASVQDGTDPVAALGDMTRAHATEVSLPAVGKELCPMPTSDWQKAVEAYQQAESVLAEVTDLHKQAKNRLRMIMATSGAAIAQGGSAFVDGAMRELRVYVQTRAGRRTLDTRALTVKAKEMGLDLDPFYKTGEPYEEMRCYWVAPEGGATA